MDSLIQVNGQAWPEPAKDGVKITNRYMLADAERTPGGMHFEQLGEVWEVAITYPSLKPSEYVQIYNGIKPFVINLSFFNPWINARQTIQCYRTDLDLQRSWRGINAPITLTFIGTEIM